MTREDYMRMALNLAVKGEGYTSPNPMVGCIVVKDGKVVTEGYHERCGEYHAERNALTRYEGDLSGADLYVTLEPCCHYGKTPPCTEIIIEKGIKRVFVGSMDSNPVVAGKGVQILREHGIYVETGILEEECRRLNEVFYYNMENKQPFVAMKYAMTLDGKIACEGGDSKWVTSESSRAYVQQLRKRYRGIMVGIGTVIADNPMLNLRLEGETMNPIRIVCDSKLRIPLDCNIVKTATDIETIVACGSSAVKSVNEKKITMLEEQGITILPVSEDEKGRIDLKELMQHLYELKIDGILLEGGGILNSSMLKENLINKVYAFIAPKLIGGEKALSPIEGVGINKMSKARELRDVEMKNIGDDILIMGYLK